MEDTIVELLKLSELKLTLPTMSEQQREHIQLIFKELKWQMLGAMSSFVSSETMLASLSQIVPMNLTDLNDSISL